MITFLNDWGIIRKWDIIIMILFTLIIDELSKEVEWYSSSSIQIIEGQWGDDDIIVISSCMMRITFISIEN